MGSLTSTQVRILTKILSGSGLHPAHEDALRFRANNEGALGALDQMEREGILLRTDNRYFVSILALPELRPKDPEADSILHLCAHLFSVVRGLYKQNPGVELGIAEIVETAELPSAKVQKGLRYLTQAPIWNSSTSDHSGAVITLKPSEDILRYTDLAAVMNRMHAVRIAQEQAGRNDGRREKQQKFKILDAPTLLESDLAKPPGVLGRAVLYLDLDNFKQINTRLTEVVVDRLILPPVHQALAKSVSQLGFAYGEGGDEFTVLLPNCSEAMAVEFARAVSSQLSNLHFNDKAQGTLVSASIGIAHGLPGEEGLMLRERANQAKNDAKAKGKNRISLWEAAGCRVV